METLFEKAKALENKREYKRAIFYYTLVLFDETDNYAAMHNRGYCKLQQAKAEASKELLTSAITDFQTSISLARSGGIKDFFIADSNLRMANDELGKINN